MRKRNLRFGKKKHPRGRVRTASTPLPELMLPHPRCVAHANEQFILFNCTSARMMMGPLGRRRESERSNGDSFFYIHRACTGPPSPIVTHVLIAGRVCNPLLLMHFNVHVHTTSGGRTGMRSHWWDSDEAQSNPHAQDSKEGFICWAAKCMGVCLCGCMHPLPLPNRFHNQEYCVNAFNLLSGLRALGFGWKLSSSAIPP